MCHRVGMRIFTMCGKSTKFANIFADIGGIDMSIDVEKSLIAVSLASLHVGIVPKGKKIQLVQRQAIFII